MLRAIQAAHEEATPEVLSSLWKYFGVITYCGYLYDNLSPRWWIFSVAIRLFGIFNHIVYLTNLVYTTYLQAGTHLLDAVVNINYACLMYLSLITMITHVANRTNVSLVMKSIYDNFYDYGETLSEELVERKKTEYERLRKFVTFVIAGVMTLSVSIFFVAKLIDKIIGFKATVGEIDGVYETGVIKLWYPFDVKASSGLQILATVYVFTNVVNCGFTLTGLNLFNVSTSVNFVHQLDVLKTAISSLESRAFELYGKRHEKHGPFTLTLHKNPDYINCVNYLLGQIIEHHQILIKRFHNSVSVLEYPMFAYVCLCAILMAASAVALPEENSPPSVKFVCCSLLIAHVLTMGFFSYGFDKVSSEAADLLNEVYFTNWYNFHPSTKKIIMIMLEKMKKPLIMRAGGISTINIKLFASVMQGFYSYVNLYQVAKRSK